MKLEFGCGKIPNKDKGWINADVCSREGIDKVFDFNKSPYPFEADTFDYVHSHCVFEHLDDLEIVMNELWRVCKKNAIIEIIVPYYNHTCAFNDPQHKHWFNEKTFYALIGEGGTPTSLEDRFIVIEQTLKPKEGLGWIPKGLLLKMSHFIPNLIIRIDVKMKVIK